jgi:hypothetical protein
VIVRRYLYLFLLSIGCMGTIRTTQVIPQLVNPQIGENIWQIVYREGITLDDVLDTTTLCCNCDFFITQADIDLNGGGFTITQPGNWCLGENIVTSQTILFSNVPGVSFDLKGRTISSTAAGAVSIVQVTGCPKAIVKNGTMIGLDLGSTNPRRNGLGLTNSADSIVEDIRVEFFASTDNPADAPPKGNIAFLANQSYTQLINCFASGPSLTGFNVVGDNSTLSNCEVSHFSGYQLAGPVTVEGVGYAITGNNNYVENCKSFGGDAQPTPASAGSIGFFIQGNSNILSRCIALNHQLNAQPPLGLLGGSGFYITGNNCELNNSTSAYNALYGIFNIGSGLTVCDNSVSNNGTDFVGTTNSDLCNLLCNDYISQARLPFTITQPGLYCVSENLEETAGNAAIIISPGVSDVTIDFTHRVLERTSVVHNSPLITIGNDCDSITLQGGRLQSNTAASNNNVAINIPDGTYRKISIEGIEFEGFDNTIILGNGGSNISFTECAFFDSLNTVITCSTVSYLTIDACEAYNHNGFLSATASPYLIIQGSVLQGNANSLENHITCTFNCDNLVIEDTQVSMCQNNGVSIHTTSNISLSNVTSAHNGNDGLFLSACAMVQLDGVTTTSNAFRGIEIETTSYLSITSCTSLRNTFEGFYFIDDITFSILDSLSQGNLASGFFLEDCININIAGCISESNANGSGFHLSTGTLNADVTACTAIGNQDAGFLSADVGSITPISLLNQRYHACHAVFNGSAPGLYDYSQANTPGLQMLPPLAGPVSGLVATTPANFFVLPVPGAAADFSTYL